MKPTTEQIEQYRKIVADAPQGATHYSNHLGEKLRAEEYLKYSDDAGWFIHNHKAWVDVLCEIDQFNSIHCLDDLRAIIALHDENAALRDAVKHIGNMFDMDDGTVKASENIGYAIDEAWELLK